MRYDLDFFIGSVTCMLVELQPDNSVERRQGKYYEHYHPCFEFHYIERGESSYLCGNKTTEASTGTLLIIPPRMYHKELSSSVDARKMTLTIDISRPSKAAEADCDFYNAFSGGGVLSVSVKDSLLEEELLKLKRLSMTGDSDFITREKMRALAHTFTVDLYHLLSKEAPSKTELSKDAAITREYEIDTFMALNFMSNSSRDELAEKLHVSPRQLHRIIKKSYGKSYREKLLEIRLEIAVNFLRDTDKSIAEISEELGYSNSASFSAFIKSSTGKTPSEIRREKRN